jgi:hypothetical protein
MAKTATFTDIATPGSLTLSLVTGGSLAANTTYYYKVIAVMEPSTQYYLFRGGQSFPSAEFSITTTTTNKSVQIQFPYTKGVVESWRIYRTTISGDYSIATLGGGCLQSFPTDALNNVLGTVTWTDTGYAIGGNNFYMNKCHGYIQLSGSAGDIWSIDDLYKLDVAGGWGVINKTGESNYEVCACVKCYSGLVWEDNSKTINFYDVFDVLTNTSFKFGYKHNLVSDIDGLVYSHYHQGCCLIIRTNYLSSMIFDVLNSYSSIWRYQAYSDTNFASISFSSGEIRDTNISGIRNFYPLSLANCSFKNVLYVSADSAYSLGLGTFENVTMIEGSRAFQISSNQTISAKGLVCYNLNYGAVLIIGTNSTVNFINTTLYNTRIGSCLVDSVGTKIYDKFTYNLSITDEEGNNLENVSVKIYDSSNTLVVNELTDSNGKIDEQEITRVYYEVLPATPRVLTPTNKYPFKIVLEKDGYENYIGFTSYLQSKNVEEQVSLKFIVNPRLDDNGKEYIVLQPKLGSKSLITKN